MFTISFPSCRPAGRTLARWALVSTIAVAGAAAAQGTATLTLDRALQLAQQRSRQLVAQDAAAGAAREMAVAAGQRPDPSLKAGINNLPVDGSDRFSLSRDFMTMRSVGVMQELTRADKRSARAGRFEREAEVAEAMRAAALAALRRDTAKAWLERHFQERVLELLQTQRGEAALQVEAAEAAWRGGRGAQAEIFAARAAAAQIDERVKQAEQQVAVAKTRLARWVGDDARQPLAPPPALELADADAATVDARVAHHPELAVIARQEGVARAEADVAERNRSPDWSVELMFSQRGSAYSNMVSVNVSVPLQWDRRNRQDRELAAKLALVDQVRAQREEAEREHAAEVRGWLQAWRGQRDRLVHYDNTLLPLAAQRTQAAVAAYRGGGGALGAVLEARRMEVDLRIERLRLEMDAAALWAQLEYLVPSEARTAVAKEQ
ncbi:TolC family protein [Aquincola sp. S2]|uniref:TolC family protein n=1 Tax=Pseudaquabacterium terrae TaxID=2732868 RepID=A0ABX2ERQ9_9BURK|nr:TolC family protein [Aquabacterium terrae]NRF71201.1 TolC family protein [Aquabacterium terrae]